MINPYHNGGDCDYAPKEGGGRYGCTDSALLDGMLHPNITFYSWAYGHSNTSSQWDPCPTCPGGQGYNDWRKIVHAPELFGQTATHGSYP